MRLSELQPRFLKIKSPKTYEYIDSLADAQGVMFLCPKCFVTNGGSVGTHMVLCWFRGRGVPDEQTPGPARWDVSGDGYETLTLSPSILLTSPGGCAWHGFVRNGSIA